MRTLEQLTVNNSKSTRVLVVTQSVTLAKQFTPQFVGVAERADRESALQRLESAGMSAWLGNCSRGEFWEKNSLGARP